ncbi:laccase iv [Grosmannia clavigera kw1407]|uniref:Laccase iv n=1 Tax=Grosmannia clavigera (strain kw1407 / UAMH 11150) TaxID=655863 RepID=F0X904_GROCL|nr:laccase iv [Grosmannia clavigera kw1407]EFX05454.1 laccase iv [Grosmannia clavigera kw1407]
MAAEREVRFLWAPGGIFRERLEWKSPARLGSELIENERMMFYGPCLKHLIRRQHDVSLLVQTIHGARHGSLGAALGLRYAALTCLFLGIAVPAHPVKCSQVADSSMTLVAAGESRPTRSPNTAVRWRIVSMGPITGLSLVVPQATMTPIHVDGGHPVAAVSGDGIGILYPGKRVDLLVTEPADIPLRLYNDMDSDQSVKEEDEKTRPLPEAPTAESTTPTDWPMQQADQTLVEYAKVQLLAKFGNRPMGFMNHSSWNKDQLVPFVAGSSSGAWVDLVINSLDDGGHPFRLHGHAIYVLLRYQTSSRVCWCSCNPFDRHKTPPESVDMTAPLLKHTVLVPQRGHVMLRFRADNWLMFSDKAVSKMTVFSKLASAAAVVLPLAELVLTDSLADIEHVVLFIQHAYGCGLTASSVAGVRGFADPNVQVDGSTAVWTQPINNTTTLNPKGWRANQQALTHGANNAWAVRNTLYNWGHIRRNEIPTQSSSSSNGRQLEARTSLCPRWALAPRPHRPPVPYNGFVSAVSLEDVPALAEEGYRAVRGRITESCYLVFESSSSVLTNHASAERVAASAATASHESVSQRRAVHVLELGTNSFQIGSALDGRWLTGSGTLASDAASAGNFTVSFAAGQGYGLQNGCGRWLTAAGMGAQVFFGPDVAYWKAYSVTYHD